MQKKNRVYVFIIICLTIVLIIGMKFAFEYGKNQANQKTLVVSNNTVDWDKQLDNKSQGTEEIKVPGYKEITVKNSSESWLITLPNPKENNCYFKYTITIDNSNEIIYESDLIEPGKAITSFKPEIKLKQGDYDLYLNINAYSLNQNLDELNGAKIKTTLHVI